MDTGDVARAVLVECIARGDVGDLETLAPDVVVRTPLRGEPFVGRAGFREYAETIRTAFPGLRLAVEDVVAEPDAAAVRWVVDADHEGELATLPATGRHVTLHGVDLFRFDDAGHVREIVSETNPLEVFAQIGAVPAGEPKPPAPLLWFLKARAAFIRGG